MVRAGPSTSVVTRLVTFLGTLTVRMTYFHLPATFTRTRTRFATRIVVTTVFVCSTVVGHFVGFSAAFPYVQSERQIRGGIWAMSASS